MGNAWNYHTILQEERLNMKQSMMHLWVLSLCAVVSLMACNSGEQTPAPTPTPDSSGTPGASVGGTGGGTPAAQRVVGFVQTGNESGWRRAHTKSMMEEGAKRGIKVNFVDAESSQEKQIAAIRNYVTQGVDAIILAPVVAEGWDNILREAKDAGVPVFLTDRSIVTSDDSLFVAFFGSNFVTEGQLAGKWLLDKVNGTARIVELVGTPGSAPAVDRATGFREAIGIAKDASRGVSTTHPGMQIIASQSGDFVLDKGKQVMEALVKQFDEGHGIDVLFAHNDDMALGAIQAIKDAGLQPGKDIIVLSIDALQTAFVAMLEGNLNATVSCNPLQGTGVFDVIEKYWAKAPFEKYSYITDQVYPREEVTQAVVDSRGY
jgi:simple sugar transport system substrate-binding protein